MLTPPDLSSARTIVRFSLGKTLLLLEARFGSVLTQRVWTLSGKRYSLFYGQGTSMAPTYDPKDSISERFYAIRKFISPSELRRGMFVQFQSNLADDDYVAKRLMALPGDILCTRSDCSHHRYVKVPPKHYWIEGDAGAKKSRDSTHYGPVPEKNFIAEVQFIIYPFKYWGKVPWELKGREILKNRIVTDPAQQRALEKTGKAQLEFIMDWSTEKTIMGRHEQKTRETVELDQKTAVRRAQAVGFLQKASVKCLQVRAARTPKARAKVATTNGGSTSDNNTDKQQRRLAAEQHQRLAASLSPTIQDATTIEDQWRAHGARLGMLRDGATAIILPGTISEADREVLRTNARLTKEKTGCRYEFIYLTEITTKTNRVLTKTSGTNKKKKKGLFALDFGDAIVMVVSVGVICWLPIPTL